MGTFKITDHDDVLKVSSSARITAGKALVLICTTGFLLFRIVSEVLNHAPPVRTWIISSQQPSPLGIAVAFVILAAVSWLIFRIISANLRALFPTGHSLECNRGDLIVGDIPNRNFSGAWSYKTFPIASIQGMRFATLSSTQYANVSGLKFESDGKEQTCLYGIKAPEASTILDALALRGILVIRDPAMPMLVEMAKSRASFLGGIFD
jgi:hypothetical protein